MTAYEIQVSLAFRRELSRAYFTDGMPKRGLPDFEYQWDEHRYRFASAEHRDLFKADPVRYAPQFGNYCAMALALGKVVTANRSEERRVGKERRSRCSPYD